MSIFSFTIWLPFFRILTVVALFCFFLLLAVAEHAGERLPSPSHVYFSSGNDEYRTQRYPANVPSSRYTAPPHPPLPDTRKSSAASFFFTSATRSTMCDWLSLGALQKVHLIYRSVVHNETGGKKASAQLDDPLNAPPLCSVTFSLSPCFLSIGCNLPPCVWWIVLGYVGCRRGRLHSVCSPAMYDEECTLTSLSERGQYSRASRLSHFSSRNYRIHSHVICSSRIE
ncbi:uncharacterized protein BT62DRAFT_1002608 [Guyanagaster necrorhizus]|uniref:Uncharacterized protein n=1 Tax=Guyanagaster necrorhizus TaxID=856835 RepID=A0A9P7VZ22_9AGAR|nr:uncharacterized protein BT62DRAFT_1002608 [Guyanagaster necrorhizus MCA 3950]KAG7449055.1 hypothetical protein BT62DRAFT_1002608 [Guyanagaster necrorhizus MCA 3950]